MCWTWIIIGIGPPNELLVWLLNMVWNNTAQVHLQLDYLYFWEQNMLHLCEFLFLSLTHFWFAGCFLPFSLLIVWATDFWWHIQLNVWLSTHFKGSGREVLHAGIGEIEQWRKDYCKAGLYVIKLDKTSIPKQLTQVSLWLLNVLLLVYSVHLSHSSHLHLSYRIWK